MATAQQTKPKLQQLLETAIAEEPYVYIGDTGFLPLEHNGEVDWDEKDSNGIVIKKHRYEPLVFGAGGRHRPLYPSRAKDKAMIDRVEAWLNDPDPDIQARIAKHGVRRLERNMAQKPFNSWDLRDADTIFTTLSNMMTGDVAADRRLVLDAARYEAENQNRVDVIEALQELIGGNVEESDLSSSVAI